MIDSASLLKDLKGRLKLLQADLKDRADDATNKWGAHLKDEYDAALKRERTGYSWSVWRDNEVDQAAVAWIVSTTFLRFCEDNDLLAGAELDRKSVAVGWISGPDDRIARTEENLNAYFLAHPDHNRRHWLQQGFQVLAAQPAGSLLIDPKHNPVWTASISQDAAASLIDFWRTTDAGGGLVHDFTDQALDTRFLGDLYQDLSDHAKKTYALLQTPVFVEEFILDQTLEPAVKEFGLDGFKMIDPTCGSGHFLLGAFARLHEKWQMESPALGRKELVRKAMDSIHGIDLNPFAVAIARFRLTVAGLQTAGETSLVGVAPMGFHLAIGDSLLGEQGGTHAGEFDIFGTQDESTFEYDGEDLSEYVGILKPDQYHAVVGNPPYILPPDKALNQQYRKAYKTATGKYALSVPFMELFFRLAVKGSPGQPAGFTGQITSNSFMKREFGKKLIEELFAGFHHDNPVDLLQVIDTSGAYIPGHGTPTVIIVGRRRRPQATAVRTVLGIRSEPGRPAEPSNGLVWTEIVRHIGNPGFDGSFVSITDLDRSALTSFPWSLSGGGALSLLEAVNSQRNITLGDVTESIGFAAITGDDDVFVRRVRTAAARQDNVPMRRFVEGDTVRDFKISGGDRAIYPYPVEEAKKSERVFWPYRTTLQNGLAFGKTREDRGNWWGEYILPNPIRLAAKNLIVFAFVTTHNHFVLDRGGKVFKQSAPVIKLPDDASEEKYLELLGVLNSSTACFWLKQVSHNKGRPSAEGAGADEPWEQRYEFTSTKLDEFPLPVGLNANRGQILDMLAREQQLHSPKNAIDSWTSPSNKSSLATILTCAEQEYDRLQMRMIFEQEELDWDVYHLYGLLEKDLTYPGSSIDEANSAGRAFAISLAREIEEGKSDSTWFSHWNHGFSPTTKIPANWPDDYKSIVRSRLDLMASDPNIRLLEKPEFKRRWAQEPWANRQRTALQGAILDHLENPYLWKDAQGACLRTLSSLAHALRDDAILQELATVYAGTANPELVDVLHLALTEAVPYLAAHRYKPSGLEKYREWQNIWELQRLEDTGDKVTIPVPPKYSKADFKKDEYWKARGKLDVQKERFISYPDLSKPNDPTPVLGWTGWSHRDQALALARELPIGMALVPEAGTEAVIPLLAGLVELEPWLNQWHKDVEPEFGMSPAAMIGQVLDTTLAGLSLTRDQITAWAPSPPTRGRKSRK